jgi:4-hydroxy-3-polyprenylbenzoate decarboxylase
MGWTMAVKRRLIVGISGATGVVLGVRLLELLRDSEVETHLVVSRAGELTRSCELSLTAQDLRELADVYYPHGDVGAPISSGSFRTMGMIIAPCSMKTLAEVASGVTGNLLSRAADVVLKERRRLVLAVRESPLSLIHLRNMATVTEAGGIIAPPVPAFYAMPETVDDLVTQTACRLLDLFDIEVESIKRWGEQINMRGRMKPDGPDK